MFASTFAIVTALSSVVRVNPFTPLTLTRPVSSLPPLVPRRTWRSSSAVTNRLKRLFK